MITARDARKYRRLQVLNFVVIFLILATITAIGLGQYSYQRFQLQREVREQSEVLHLGTARKVVARELRQVVVDLHILAESHDLQSYLNNPDALNSNRLKEDFVNLSRQAARYDQVRLLDKNGYEKIRVNYVKGAPQVVPSGQLQDKSGRYYFRNSINLPEGMIYISPLDLNMENGAIELPYKPMIRMAIPLIDHQHKQRVGVVVLNYFAKNLLDYFKEIMTESWGKPMMLNRDGYWLISPDKKEEWGFMLGNKTTFADRYPLAWAAMLKSDEGSVRTSEGLFTFTTLRPDVIADFAGTNLHVNSLVWRLLTRVSPDNLHFSLWRTIRENMTSVLSLGLMITLLSFMLARLRTNNIEKTEALSASSVRYQNLFENMEEGYALLEALFDENGKVYDFCYLEVNPAFERILGLKRVDVVGRTIRYLVPDIEDYWMETYERVATRCQSAHLERYNAKFERYFEITAASPDYGMVAVLFADVSERKHAEEQQRQATTAFNNTMEAIMITDAEQKITVVNEAYTRITGYEAEDIIGTSARKYWSDRHDEAFIQKLSHSLEESGHWQGEIWNLRSNGELYPAWGNISVVKDDQGRISNYVSVFSDISTIKQTEERLNELAHRDSLTGLANRLAFKLNLEKSLERASRHQHTVALMFLDLDRFKFINDTLGHAMGDKMLQIVSKRLLNSVRAEDMVARLGGDEFTIILEDIDDREDVAILAHKIIDIIAAPMKLHDQDVKTSASIGISLYPEDASTAENLEKAADTAMYRAKNKGRNNFEFCASITEAEV